MLSSRFFDNTANRGENHAPFKGEYIGIDVICVIFVSPLLIACKRVVLSQVLSYFVDYVVRKVESKLYKICVFCNFSC